MQYVSLGRPPASFYHLGSEHSTTGETLAQIDRRSLAVPAKRDSMNCSTIAAGVTEDMSPWNESKNFQPFLAEPRHFRNQTTPSDQTERRRSSLKCFASTFMRSSCSDFSREIPQLEVLYVTALLRARNAAVKSVNNSDSKSENVGIESSLKQITKRALQYRFSLKPINTATRIHLIKKHVVKTDRPPSHREWQMKHVTNSSPAQSP